MKLVGLTGGIGSGKTTVATVFESLSIPVFNSDLAARALLAEDEKVVHSVINLLGADAYHPDGSPDRKRIAQLVFTDPPLLNALNAIIHPAVRQSTLQWIESLPDSVDYCIKEAAILFESGAAAQCDQVVVVTARTDVRIERIMARDDVSRGDVEERMNNQWPQEKIAGMADFCIENNPEQSLIQQVLDVHNALSA
ncbi:MAG: dephospho-CoA kinase [Cryomorphaceae bacterium]